MTIESPLLDSTVEGGVYVRSQASSDPGSGDMFRIAIVAASEERGVRVKLAGKVAADPVTGRLVTTFDNNPQLPFSRFTLRFKGGARAALATPPGCGPQQIDARLSSWSGKTVELADTFSVSCPGIEGFSPTLAAGPVDPVPAAFSPFAVTIQRADGQQFIDGLTLGLPTGVSAKLKGVPLCSGAQADAGACPAGSRIGSATVGAGPGASPFYLQGQPAYLTEGYKGAPYGLAVVARAIAGPFDLGTVVVRQAIHVDRTDGHLTVASDPIPTIVKGVPLRLRTIHVDVDRKDFTLTPTACNQKQVRAIMHSQQGSIADVTTSFKLGQCSRLPFRPKLSLALTGRTQISDGKHPGLKATLTQPGSGQANITKVAVKLPLSLALDPGNAQSDGLCEFAEGQKAEPRCPRSSIIGRATAVTPILNRLLTGNVYFVKNVRRSSTGRLIRTLPTLLIPLRGDVSINLRAQSSVKDDRLVSTFATVPDAPVSRFTLSLKGGKRGILVVTGNRNLCKGKQMASIGIVAHNGKVANSAKAMKAPCGRPRSR